MSNHHNQEAISIQLEAYFSKNKQLDANKIDLHQKLTATIQKMINDDYASLIQLLYRIDVSEQELKIKLKNAPIDNSAQVIADAIIDRWKEKIKTRKAFSPKNDIPEDERW